MSNRVLSAIARMKAQIKERVKSGKTTRAEVKETHKAMDMTIPEHARFQTLKTLAVAQGKLSLEEGQTVYELLGGTASHFNRQLVEVKAVLTSLFRELLTLQIASKGE